MCCSFESTPILTQQLKRAFETAGEIIQLPCLKLYSSLPLFLQICTTPQTLPSCLSKNSSRDHPCPPPPPSIVLCVQFLEHTSFSLSLKVSGYRGSSAWTTRASFPSFFFSFIYLLLKLFLLLSPLFCISINFSKRPPLVIRGDLVHLSDPHSLFTFLTMLSTMHKASDCSFFLCTDQHPKEESKLFHSHCVLCALYIVGTYELLSENWQHTGIKTLSRKSASNRKISQQKADGLGISKPLEQQSFLPYTFMIY